MNNRQFVRDLNTAYPGIVVRWLPDTSEYRVNLAGGREATAAYETDREAARGTAAAMYSWGLSSGVCENVGAEQLGRV